jgi:hypothetical protein
MKLGIPPSNSKVAENAANYYGKMRILREEDSFEHEFDFSPFKPLELDKEDEQNLMSGIECGYCNFLELYFNKERPLNPIIHLSIMGAKSCLEAIWKAAEKAQEPMQEEELLVKAVRFGRHLRSDGLRLNVIFTGETIEVSACQRLLQYYKNKDNIQNVAIVEAHIDALKRYGRSLANEVEEKFGQSSGAVWEKLNKVIDVAVSHNESVFRRQAIWELSRYIAGVVETEGDMPMPLLKMVDVPPETVRAIRATLKEVGDRDSSPIVRRMANWVVGQTDEELRRYHEENIRIHNTYAMKVNKAFRNMSKKLLKEFEESMAKPPK